MARQIFMVAKPKQGRTDPSAVPDDVKSDIEDVYKNLADGTVARVDFETKAELNEFVRQARTYCENRTLEDDTAAPLVFRKSPKKGTPETTLYFRVTAPDSEESTEA